MLSEQQSGTPWSGSMVIQFVAGAQVFIRKVISKQLGGLKKAVRGVSEVERCQQWRLVERHKDCFLRWELLLWGCRDPTFADTLAG
jgi:hypothetical protein